MSAWIVSKAHIDALVQEMVAREVIPPERATAVGRELWEECRLSVAYRYPRDKSGERPGPVDLTDEIMAEYVFEGVEAPLHPEAIRFNIRCYNYQSCEHPGWESSQSFRWMRDLELSICGQLGIFPDDPIRGDQREWPWGIDDINDVIDQSQMGAR